MFQSRTGWCGVALAAAYAALGVTTAAAAPNTLPSKLGPRLARQWRDLAPATQLVVWVDLRDADNGAAIRPVSEPSARRRARTAMCGADLQDRRLDATSVSAVRARVRRVRVVSRWLRSLSVEATRAQLEQVAALAAVVQIETVARGVQPEAAVPGGATPAGPPAQMDGPWQQQLGLLRVPELHALGITGVGVLVAHFDTGYERFTHQVFRSLRVAAMRDFVDGDGDPTELDEFPSERGDHGTITLSVLGGHHPGGFVGAAPGAGFALARTERSSVESAVEEDYWIAALEWADSLGADIVSSSLKFREVDSGTDPGYSWLSMDGSTARVTRAARVAERRGMLVFNGAGNDGWDPLHNTLVAPADGVDVVAVGAITLAGAIADFSSCGPTTDPPARIKPDLLAPGAGVWAAAVQHDSAYARASGTSLSTPLAAGVAALLLSAHRATPAQIRDVLRRTASRATSPDNRWGWGVIDALAAYQALIALFPADPPSGPAFANPFPRHASIAYAIDVPGTVTLRIYDAYGRRVRELVRAAQEGRAQQVAWDGTDDSGRALPRGMYFVELRAPRRDGPPAVATRKLTLVD